ncbi:hypothetical protein BH09CHL1_BH09CHL1_13480 [soil metagenome]
MPSVSLETDASSCVTPVQETDVRAAERDGGHETLRYDRR